MRTGKDMQYFGARCNLAKLLLYTLNNGVDEKSGNQVGPKYGNISPGVMKFDEVYGLFLKYIKWLAKVYVETMNIIHWSHDRYCYESLQMALHDTYVRRLIAFGIAGVSHVADSLSAIKYAKVTPVRDDKGIAKHFTIEGDFPRYGNDDEKVDSIAVDVVKFFMAELRSHPTYRKSVPTLSILTITSNVVYGRATGDTPDGRLAGVPFAPGASPSYGADTTGAANSLASVAKLPFSDAQDGISNTFAILPSILGKDESARCHNLATLINQYFDEQPSKTRGFHLNVNCVTVETLKDAMEHPEKYPQLTVRVSGYAVNFVRLTKEQQKDVLSRTFHDSM
jgi:formate C-acetyltransferase